MGRSLQGTRAEIGTSTPTDIVELDLDRPFLFFIDDLNGVVLFSGQVVDPTQKE